MEFFEVIQRRKSIRTFSSRPVNHSDIVKVLETTRRIPSAGGLRSFLIHEFYDKDTKEAIAIASAHQMFIAEAPVVLIFSALPEKAYSKYGNRGAQLYSVQEATIACAYAQLAITALGLASVWIGAFSEHKILGIIRKTRMVLDLEIRPVAILPFGYGGAEDAEVQHEL